ncbi:hypothetical protein CRUP_001886, partial [Coryphaenoides rupestris]
MVVLKTVETAAKGGELKLPMLPVLMFSFIIRMLAHAVEGGVGVVQLVEVSFQGGHVQLVTVMHRHEQQTVVLLPRSPSVYLPIPVEKLEDEYRLRSADDGKLFREEYNSLAGGSAQGTCEEANKESNKDKNRYPNILPFDHSRVALTQLEGNPCSDYVNASYINGYTEKNKFIATQGPTEDTVVDFWRMIWEQKVATVREERALSVVVVEEVVEELVEGPLPEDVPGQQPNDQHQQGEDQHRGED